MTISLVQDLQSSASAARRSTPVGVVHILQILSKTFKPRITLWLGCGSALTCSGTPWPRSRPHHGLDSAPGDHTAARNFIQWQARDLRDLTGTSCLKHPAMVTETKSAHGFSECWEVLETSQDPCSVAVNPLKACPHQSAVFTAAL